MSPLCGEIAVEDPAHGVRVLDPALGHFVAAPITPAESNVRFAATASGGLVVWGPGHVDLRDRKSAMRIWQSAAPSLVPRRLVVTTDLLVEQSAPACAPECAMIALFAASGREAWRRPCACEKDPPSVLGAAAYEEIEETGGVLIVVRRSTLEAWDPATGRTLWERARRETVTALGGHVILTEYEPPARVVVLDVAGHELGIVPLPPARPLFEAITADATTVFIASSDAPPPAGEGRSAGGRAHVAILGFDLATKKEVFRARWKALAGTAAPVVERAHAGGYPSLWVDGRVVYFHDLDSGLLTAFDRATGNVISTLGVAGKDLVRSAAGFMFVDDLGLALVEPSDAESPPAERAIIRGVLRLDGKPKSGAAILVGDVEVTTGSGGAFTASVVGRGSLAVHVHQPNPDPRSTRYWENGHAVVTLDGRNAPYVIDIAAVTDSYD